MELERPVFELRVTNDHVLKLEALYKSLPASLQPTFLEISQALPSVIMSCSSEEKLLFVRVYILLRQATDDSGLQRLKRAVLQANGTISAPTSAPLCEKVIFWQSADLRAWADAFEAVLTKGEQE